jgi:AraC-like DNA-binding protein
MGRGPYFNIKEAAAYCGYKSESHFGKLLRDYRVPRKGPGGTRYAQADLDRFMDDPRAFIPTRRPSKISFDLQL